MPDTIPIPTVPNPVWTPYTPEDCIGDFGWLWLDGPMGFEWVLVQTVHDDEDPEWSDGIIIDAIGRADASGTRECWAAASFAGTPYLPCTAPTVEPGKSDALEVAIRFAPGASATHAFGHSDRLEDVKAATFAAMGIGRGKDA